jgi:integrase
MKSSNFLLVSFTRGVCVTKFEAFFEGFRNNCGLYALVNRKHKVILFTAYSAGLRVSEVVNLKQSHIDSSRMQVFIERAKGKKDWYVALSPILTQKTELL